MALQNATQPSRIADELLCAIRDGQWAVGAKLPSERQLAEQYGVSRPVVREALRMLSTLDVIDVQMGRGAFVLDADVNPASAQDFSLLDIIDAREAIERGAIRLARERADVDDLAGIQAAMDALSSAVDQRRETAELDLELHRSIVSASGSAKLLRLWTDMTDDIARTIRVSPHGRTMSREILAGHRDLVEGLQGPDDIAADRACSALYVEHRAFLRSLFGL